MNDNKGVFELWRITDNDLWELIAEELTRDQVDELKAWWLAQDSRPNVVYRILL